MLLLLLLLLLLRPLDDAKHSDVKAIQHSCVHVCKGTRSSCVAFEADRLVLQHSKDGLHSKLCYAFDTYVRVC